MATLKKLYGVLTKVEEIFCSVFFLALVLLIVFDVCCRKITGSSLSWLEELSRMMFVSVTLITASVAVTTDEHPRMNALQTALGVKRGNYMILLTDVICAAFFAIMLPYAVQSVTNMYTFGTAFVNIPFKLWQVYVFFPLSFAGILVRHIVRIIVGVQRIRHGQDIERGEEQ